MLMIYPHLFRNLPYNPLEDLTPVSLCAWFQFGLACGPAVPEAVTTVAQFLDWCKANPAKATFGSPAAGSTPHLMVEVLAKQAGVPLQHAAYRGTQAAIVDMIGGNLAAAAGPEGEFLSHMGGGKVRLLATSGERRSRFTPQTPTFFEQGFRSVNFREWFGAFLPAKAPPAAVARAEAAFRTAAPAIEAAQGLAIFGCEAAASSSAEMGRLLREDLQRWGTVLRELNLPADRLPA
jgi:tripartite-type tricarboxylate transporter receptor subunit TctC